MTQQQQHQPAQAGDGAVGADVLVGRVTDRAQVRGLSEDESDKDGKRRRTSCSADGESGGGGQ
jgi:hypothetical protein